METMEAMVMNRPNFPEYTLPILCLHGTKDITTSLSAAQAFVEVRRPCSLTRTATLLAPLRSSLRYIAAG